MGLFSSERERAVVDGSLVDFAAKTADFLCRHGLRVPVLVFLEAGQPLAFLGGQLLWIAQPALSLFFPSAPIQQTARLLEHPEAVARLIAQLNREEVQ